MIFNSTCRDQIKLNNFLLTIILKITLLFLLISIFSTTALYASPQSLNQLVVGSEEEYPPFSIGYTDANADGFTVDLWKAVAAKAKLKYVIHVKPFKSLLSDIKSGEVDVLINLAQSEERRKFVDFTVPHVTVSGGIFLRKTSDSIYSEDDLVAKEVIVLSGDLAHDYALTKPWGKKLILVDSASDGFNLLSSGKHDALVISKLAGEKVLKQLKIRNVQLIEAGVGFQQKFSFAVKEGDSDLLAKINEGLALVKESGEYDAIYDKWFAIYNLEPPTFSNAFYFSSLFAFFSLVAAGYHFYRRTFENKRTLSLVRETNKNFENLLSAASQYSIIATDTQGKITTFNTGAQSLLGYNSFDLIDKENITTLHDRSELELKRSNNSEYSKRFLTDFQALTFKTLLEGFEKFECTYFSKEQKKINVLLNVSPMRNSEDILIGYLFIAQDITEQKKLEGAQFQYLDRLRQSEAQKSAILECAPYAIMIMNKDGDFVEFNPAAENIFDYKRSEVIGKKVANLIIPNKYRHQHGIGMKAYIESGKSSILGRKVELPAIRRDGSEFQMEIIVIPFDLDDEQYFLSYGRELSSYQK